MNFPDDLQMIPCLLNYPIPQFARMQSAKLLTSESAAGRLTDHRLVTQRINHEIRKVTTTKGFTAGSQHRSCHRLPHGQQIWMYLSPSLTAVTVWTNT